MNYRNKKLTQSAKNESCVSCGTDDGTIVWAHSNRQKHGKGMGIKAHDLFGAYLCSRCHKDYDELPEHRFIELNIDGFNKTDWFIYVWERSMLIACTKSYL